MDDGLLPLELTTLALEVAEGVATVTLDRPQVHNAFDQTMTAELAQVWQALRRAPEVRAVEDPGRLIGPRSQELWKPLVAAVNGMACGGAFYILGEADVIVAANHATFFDPHVTYGMVAAFEPILLLRRMPFGEVLRMALAGSAERVSAATAMRLGLVSEVVPSERLLPAAQELARIFASQ